MASERVEMELERHPLKHSNPPDCIDPKKQMQSKCAFIDEFVEIS